MAIVDQSQAALRDHYENIIILQALLRNSTIVDLPERYVWTQALRHNSTSSNAAQELADLALPIIDISCLAENDSGDPAAKRRVSAEISAACEQWGFFQIVNHGIPKELMDDVDVQARKFFALPVEIKEKAKYDVNLKKDKAVCGYNGRLPRLSYNTPWMEYFSDRGEVETLTRMIWPDGNPTLSKPLQEFWENLHRLGKRLLEVVAVELGLEARFFSQLFDENIYHRSTWRYNHYPACPRPDLTLAMGPHSDPNLLTLLRQDAVGGLQVKRAGKWVDVTPVPGALIINVGDALEAWSNGRFKSVEHRVLVNEHRDRFSAVYLMAPAENQIVGAPPQLIDEEHPSLYRPFLYGDYMEHMMSIRLAGKNCLDYARRYEATPQQATPS
ncbi:hypothetical protein R1sor_009930 [Riccia sorocarpa]|uniref:Fe2OG dioxygenase domain-containing protein n=1 Tax=Riccia sorocarpa TaxID=122646 RepID=A0ABD3I2L1_9MARC